MAILPMGRSGSAAYGSAGSGSGTGRRGSLAAAVGRGAGATDVEVDGIPVETTDPDWFDLGVLVKIDGRSIPFTPLFTALSMRRTKLLLVDGSWFSLAHPALDALRELIDEATELSEWETGPRISRYQTALWEDFEDLADEARPALAWRETADGLREATTVPPVPVPADLRAELRPYQRQGFDWLAFLWSHRLGGYLARVVCQGGVRFEIGPHRGHARLAQLHAEFRLESAQRCIADVGAQHERQLVAPAVETGHAIECHFERRGPHPRCRLHRGLHHIRRQSGPVAQMQQSDVETLRQQRPAAQPVAGA